MTKPIAGVYSVSPLQKAKATFSDFINAAQTSLEKYVQNIEQVNKNGYWMGSYISNNSSSVFLHNEEIGTTWTASMDKDGVLRYCSISKPGSKEAEFFELATETNPNPTGSVIKIYDKKEKKNTPNETEYHLKETKYYSTPFNRVRTEPAPKHLSEGEEVPTAEDFETCHPKPG